MNFKKIKILIGIGICLSLIFLYISSYNGSNGNKYLSETSSLTVSKESQILSSNSSAFIESGQAINSSKTNLVYDSINKVLQGKMVIIGTTENNLFSAIDRLDKKDKVMLESMFDDGKIFFVDINTNYTVLKENILSLKVQIKEGYYKGIVGWVAN